MKKSFIILLIMLLLAIVYLFFSKYNEQDNSSTVQLIILDKFHEGDKYGIHIITNDDLKKEGNLIIREKKIWDLLKIGEEYFAVVSWKSAIEPPELFKNETYVEKIELMN